MATDGLCSMWWTQPSMGITIKFLIFVGLFTCISSAQSQSFGSPEVEVGCVATPRPCQHSDSDGVDLIFLGDWGGSTYWPYRSPQQKRVAQAMSLWHSKHGIDGVVSLGDNFYSEIDNVNSKRFSDTYEDVYNDEKFRQIPWYIIGGNHDHRNNISAQLAYAKKSDRWIYPELFYTVKYELVPSRVRVGIVMIDTVVLCGDSLPDSVMSKIVRFFTREREGAEDQPTYGSEGPGTVRTALGLDRRQAEDINC